MMMEVLAISHYTQESQNHPLLRPHGPHAQVAQKQI